MTRTQHLAVISRAPQESRYCIDVWHFDQTYVRGLNRCQRPLASSLIPRVPRVLESSYVCWAWCLTWLVRVRVLILIPVSAGVWRFRLSQITVIKDKPHETRKKKDSVCAISSLCFYVAVLTFTVVRNWRWRAMRVRLMCDSCRTRCLSVLTLACCLLLFTMAERTLFSTNHANFSRGSHVYRFRHNIYSVLFVSLQFCSESLD